MPETPTTGRMIHPGTYSPPAEVSSHW